MTLGYLLREYGGRLLGRYPQPPGVERALRLLAACRTRVLGGHATRCDHCGDVVYHYHSCGDRHCPQCGGAKRARWLAQRQAELLDVPYFHLVFTLPHELSALALGNRKLLYGLLFSAASAALMHLGADPRHLGARLGALAVLHTWGQRLEHHPHVHMVVPGGGLACDRGGVVAEPWRWRASRPNFLLPVKVLGRVFRGKYLQALRQAYDNGKLHFAGSTAALAHRPAFHALVSTLYGKDWVVYAKKPFAGAAVLLKYLTRYTHRVALDNRRLLKLDDERVTLTYKDYAAGGAVKEMTLPAVELLRRFALHVMPGGFVRLRHYGLLTHRSRGARLARCRALLSGSLSKLSSPAVPAAPSAPASAPLVLAGALVTAAAAGAAPSVHPSPSEAPLVEAPLVEAPLVEAPLVEALVSDELCRSCRQGRRETFWFCDRPRGRDFERHWLWNTS